MFKGITIRLTEPICLCLERKLSWNVVQKEKGPTLDIWCRECGVTVHIPNDQFKASWDLEQDYPGKPEPKKPVEVVTPKPGDVIDLGEHIRKRRENEPPS